MACRLSCSSYGTAFASITALVTHSVIRTHLLSLPGTEYIWSAVVYIRFLAPYQAKYSFYNERPARHPCSTHGQVSTGYVHLKLTVVSCLGSRLVLIMPSKTYVQSQSGGTLAYSVCFLHLKDFSPILILMAHWTAVTFVFACLAIKLWPTKMTIWALVVALLLGKSRSAISHDSYADSPTIQTAFFFLIPIGKRYAWRWHYPCAVLKSFGTSCFSGMIQAITNRSVGIKYALSQSITRVACTQIFSKAFSASWSLDSWCQGSP